MSIGGQVLDKPLLLDGLGTDDVPPGVRCIFTKLKGFIWDPRA